MSAVTPLEISNAFVANHGGNGGISHMKLQKLVYLFHGHWLKENPGRSVTADPEVWQYGPVFGPLYQKLKTFRAAPIRAPAPEADGLPAPTTSDANHIALIDRVWRQYGKMTGGQLSDLTHEPGSPWHTMAVKYDFRVPKGLTIPEDLIRSHYRTSVPQLPR